MRRVCLVFMFAMLQLRTPWCEGVNVTGIRLVNQDTGAEVDQVGVVQIQVDGGSEWGHICDDGFVDQDAFVVCRMLGYTNGGSADTQGRFPPGALQEFFMDDTGCTGDEPSLAECIAAQQPDCIVNSDTIVRVTCNDNRGPGDPDSGTRTTTPAAPDTIIGVCANTGTNPNPNVRLYGKQNVPGMGFVEVRNPNNANDWAFVCDDSWNAAAALVVCRELCYDTQAYIPKPGIPAENAVLPNNPVIGKDDVQCSGNEASLVDCPSSQWRVENCENNELAGVQCVAAQYQPPPPPVPILECRQGLMIAQFSTVRDPDLEEKHLIVYNGGVACPDVTKSSSGNFVVIEIPVNRCGTSNSQSNTTHIVYRNTISYLYTSQEGFITRKNTYQVEITCALPTGLTVTQRVQPLTESVTQKAQGIFVTSMEIYRNDSFEAPVTESPVRIPLGEWLNMAVTVEDNDPNLKVVLTDCVATPTGDTSQQPLQSLVNNKCPSEDTISIYPLSNFKMGFRFKPFKFVGHDLLYVHCEALVCRAEDITRLCDRTCNNQKPETTGKRRRKRALYDKRFETIISPAIILYDPYAAKPAGGNQANSPDVNVDTDVKPVVNLGSGSSNNVNAAAPTTLPPVAATTASPQNTQQQQPPQNGGTLHVSDAESENSQNGQAFGSESDPRQEPSKVDSSPDVDSQESSGSESNARPKPPSFIGSRNAGSSLTLRWVSCFQLLRIVTPVVWALFVGHYF